MNIHHSYSLPFVQDGVMIPFSKDIESEMKHSLKKVGKKYVFTVNSLDPEDAGIYQVDVEGVNIFSTDFKRTFFCSTFVYLSVNLLLKRPARFPMPA